MARGGLLALAAAGLVACGGGGGGAGPSPAPGEAQLSSTAEVGAAGGTLGTQGLRLEIPAGALDRPTTISILSFTPGTDELARYRFAPAGLTLQTPATLRVPVGTFPPDARLYWQVDGETLLLPATRDGNMLVARLGVLGFAANGAVLEAAQGMAQGSSARILSARESLQETAPAGTGDLVVALANCERDIEGLKGRMRNAAQLNNLEMATTIFNELEAIQAGCNDLRIEQLHQDACTGMGAAVAQASGSPSRTFEDVRRRTAALLGSMAYVQETGATCAGDVEDRADALLPRIFGEFVDTLLSGIRDGSLFEDAGPRELSQLLNYQGHCQELGLEAVCDRFTDQIYPDLLDAMRLASFNECRATNSTLVVSQLHAMGARLSKTGQFFDYGRFTLTDVRHDISYCTNPRVEVRVFEDALEIPAEIVERRQDLQLAPALGDYRRQTTVEVPRNGSLNVNAVFRGQRCATGESLPADLVVRLGIFEVARRPLNTSGNHDLSAQPLDVVMSRLLEQAGLDSETTQVRLNFQLERGSCTLPAERGEKNDLVVLDTIEKLFEINVVLPSGPAEPGPFRGPMHFTEEKYEPGFVQLNHTSSYRSSVTVTGQFEEVNSIQGKLTGVHVVVDAEHRSLDRRAFGSPGCQYTRVQESVSTTQGNAVVQDTTVNGGLEIDRPQRAWRFYSTTIGVRVPTQIVLSTRFENVSGNCSAHDLTPRTETTTIQNLNVSVGVKDPNTLRSVIGGPIAGDPETGLSFSVLGGENITNNNGGYLRTSVSMQLVDR